MRDVSHQSSGAEAMGFSAHNLNMAQKFARSISESKDYCCYWEINRYDLPAPADYTSDEDFWYNLPASFDLLDCCMRMYRWTGNRQWLEDPDLQRFYRLTMQEYIARWDKNGDGIPERAVAGSVRGIPSYDESGHSDALMMNDLLGTQAAACDAYAFSCVRPERPIKLRILRPRPPVSADCSTPSGGTKPKAAITRFSSPTGALSIKAARAFRRR